MPRHRRLQHPHRAQRRRLDPQQRRLIRLQAIRIAHRRRIIRLHGTCRRRIRLTTARIRSHGHIPTNNSLRGRVAHPPRPEIVHVPRLHQLRYGRVIPRGDKIHKDVLHARGHGRGRGSTVQKRNGVVPAV